MAKPIFISYRRDKTLKEAVFLHWVFEREFGDGVSFLDTSIDPGEDYQPKILNAARECTVFLSLIHPKWHFDQDAAGKRTIDQPRDWIRREITAALNANRIVIPLRIDGAYSSGFPKQETGEDDLPGEVYQIFGKQAFSFQFDDSAQTELGKLIGHLKSHLPDHWQVANDPPTNSQPGSYFPGVLERTYPLPDDLKSAIPEAPSPYVGARSFQREHARIFFGRSREIYELCHKLIHGNNRLLLLDGYSGTGKSSLLQAGLIPRIEAKGWSVRYARREQNNIAGLPKLLADQYEEIEHAPNEKLIILDQVEEVLTNPIKAVPHEISELIDGIVNALEDDLQLRIVLGFRAEFAAHMKRELDRHITEPAYDTFTVHVLDKAGMIEAIRSVTLDKTINGKGKPYHLRFRPANHLPDTIATKLINGKSGPDIAMLLQVNMRILWERCQQKKGLVEIDRDALSEFIETHDQLLEHYLRLIRQKISDDQAGDQRLLRLLKFYVEQQPASKVRFDREFEREFGGESYATELRQACTQSHLLDSGNSGGEPLTRLAHDAFAEVIEARYSQLTEQKVVTRGSDLFERLKRDIEQQIHELQYSDAVTTLGDMMEVEEQRSYLHPYLFELEFFWNEADVQPMCAQVLEHWVNSGSLSGLMRERAIALRETRDRELLRQWLESLDGERLSKMSRRYLAPEQDVMIPIQGGRFMMGDETGDLPDFCRPVHEVEVDSFSLGATPVTWYQYALHLFANDASEELKTKSPRWGFNGDHPVINIDWHEAVMYCNWLSEQLGLSPYYDVTESNQVRLIGGTGFRLPTEAEWEYACRASETSKFGFGNEEQQLSEHAWFETNSDRQTQAVRTKKANGWGLYDMHGNVWEWCYDWFREKYDDQKDLASNPTGPELGSSRVIRGGGWLGNAGYCRSAVRARGDPEYRNVSLGFRIARSSV